MLFCLILFMHLLQLRGEYLHGLLSVGLLTALRRGAYINARGGMNQTYGGFDLVHILAACPAAAGELHPDIRRINLHGRLDSYRQDRDRGRGGVYSPRLLCRWHSLDTVYARLVAERFVGPGGSHLEREVVERGNAPPLSLRILLVHAAQVVGEEGGL